MGNLNMDNNELLDKYPWLKLRNVWTNEEIEEIEDNEFTWLDDMPEGWRVSFGEKMVRELDKILKKANFQNNYKIVQIKEKWRIFTLV